MVKNCEVAEEITVPLPVIRRQPDSAAPRGGIRLSLSAQEVKEAVFVSGCGQSGASDFNGPDLAPELASEPLGPTQLAQALVLEQFLDLEVPPPEQWLRTLYFELVRLRRHTHLLTVGFAQFGLRAALTELLFCHRLVVEQLEVFPAPASAGSIFQPGGSRRPPDTEFYRRAATLLESLPARLAEVEDFFEHPVFLDRTRGVGELEIEAALDWNITGPALRATGVDWDLRRTAPCCKYEAVDFKLPVGNNGDLYDRFLVRLKEMQQSLKIVEQVLEQLPEFEAVDNVPEVIRKADCNSQGTSRECNFSNTEFQLPETGISLALEASCGEQGWELEAGEKGRLVCRLRRRPGIYNLQLLLNLLPGCSAAEARATINSFETV